MGIDFVQREYMFETKSGKKKKWKSKDYMDLVMKNTGTSTHSKSTHCQTEDRGRTG
jgi:hypothetical protein